MTYIQLLWSFVQYSSGPCWLLSSQTCTWSQGRDQTQSFRNRLLSVHPSTLSLHRKLDVANDTSPGSCPQNQPRSTSLLNYPWRRLSVSWLAEALLQHKIVSGMFIKYNLCQDLTILRRTAVLNPWVASYTLVVQTYCHIKLVSFNYVTDKCVVATHKSK